MNNLPKREPFENRLFFGTWLNWKTDSKLKATSTSNNVERPVKLPLKMLISNVFEH